MNNDYLSSNGSIVKCTICGCNFLCYPEWVYKVTRQGRRIAIFCTYGCMRTYQKREENIDE
jgi:hypothetical protein